MLIASCLILVGFRCSSHPPVANKEQTLVVLIHGIMSKPAIMWRVDKFLKDSGYNTLNFDYASTREVMDSIVVKLEKDLNDVIDQYENIYFITHSLGGLVCRAYLSDHHSNKYKLLLMIAPPNRGSIIAEKLKDFKPYQWLFGPAGQGLGKDETDYWKLYPSPNIPFGIIAGGTGKEKGINPIIPGDDDGVVATEETELSGYEDYIIVHGTHTTLLWQNNVIEQVMAFLETQKFAPVKY